MITILPCSIVQGFLCSLPHHWHASTFHHILLHWTAGRFVQLEIILKWWEICRILNYINYIKPYHHNCLNKDFHIFWKRWILSTQPLTLDFSCEEYWFPDILDSSQSLLKNHLLAVTPQAGAMVDKQNFNFSTCCLQVNRDLVDKLNFNFFNFVSKSIEISDRFSNLYKSWETRKIAELFHSN